VWVDTVLIVCRYDQLHVSPRVLQQAPINYYQIDSVEASLLTVLRHELGVAQVEHFLIEHHTDLREVWRTPQLFERELDALRNAGVIFVRNDRALVPSDQVPNIRRVLGIDMSRADATRLYGYLQNPELHQALSISGLATSGTKEDRIARLITNMVQPRTALLDVLTNERLRELCRDIGTTLGGSKEDIVNRIISFISADKDIAPEPEQPAPIREERRLDRRRFGLLFEQLKAHDLTSLLIAFDLKRSGTKDVQIQTLWDAERAELTLLDEIGSTDLELLLKRIGLKSNGTKAERTERLLAHFEAMATEEAPPV